ncbi:MAG: hypothetical protein GZ086_07490 [Gelidibacter sp.]|nr:hypothetical protein [Gelidibacter sp.]
MKIKIITLFVAIVFISEISYSKTLKRDPVSYNVCINMATGDYWVNLWNEGSTYAGIVYNQTISWCGTNYNI